MSNGIREFIHDTRDLMHVRRFTTVRGFQDESVAEHSYYTALYAMIICDMEESAGRAVDKLEVLRRCLVHDLDESRVSDIPRPIKYANPEAQATITKISQQAYRELVSNLPENLHEDYFRLWSKDSSYESMVEKAADLLEALAWAIEEQAMGNMRVKSLNIAHSILEEIRKIGVPSATEIAEQLLSEV
jgi:5'-deoxynucleotidase YfbR-like HD superfamily hydrolase